LVLAREMAGTARRVRACLPGRAARMLSCADEGIVTGGDED
jgi:hypothetical protein